MKEKRRYERSRVSLDLDITSLTGETRTFPTHDVSGGGVFVLAQYADQFPIDAAVTVTLTQHAHKPKGQIMRGRVARRNGEGMGVEFLLLLSLLKD